MKKQQNAAPYGKQLSRKQMKNLSGGVAAAGTWVCPSDGYSCFATKSQCLSNCPNKVCLLYGACP